MQEQIHWLRSEQFAIRSRRNWIELPHVIGPGEFNLKSAASAIVTNAANLNILYGLPFDRQWFDAMDTITNPIPTIGAPVEIRIEIDIHFGSMSVFARTSRQIDGLTAMLRSVLIQLLPSL